MDADKGFGHHGDPALDFLSEVGRIAQAWDRQPEGEDLARLATAVNDALGASRDLPRDDMVAHGRSVLGEISAGLDALVPQPGAASLPDDPKALSALLAKRARMEAAASELEQPCWHPGEAATKDLLDHAAKRMAALEACLRAVASSLSLGPAGGPLPEDPATYVDAIAALQAQNTAES